jgi:hypothetical protein
VIAGTSGTERRLGPIAAQGKPVAIQSRRKANFS